MDRLGVWPRLEFRGSERASTDWRLNRNRNPRFWHDCPDLGRTVEGTAKRDRPKTGRPKMGRVCRGGIGAKVLLRGPDIC